MYIYIYYICIYRPIYKMYNPKEITSYHYNSHGHNFSGAVPRLRQRRKLGSLSTSDPRFRCPRRRPRRRRRKQGRADPELGNSAEFYPSCSMYVIFTYIYPQNGPNVGKYSIHGASGYGCGHGY